MPDTSSITAGKELLEIAMEFQKLSDKINTLSYEFNNKVSIMESKDFYDGRNRENISLANKAAANHIVNLSEFYSMCYAYILSAYSSMVNMDKELAKAIEKAYIGEHYG